LTLTKNDGVSNFVINVHQVASYVKPIVKANQKAPRQREVQGNVEL
jgi:hypothetical protein